MKNDIMILEDGTDSCAETSVHKLSVNSAKLSIVLKISAIIFLVLIFQSIILFLNNTRNNAVYCIA